MERDSICTALVKAQSGLADIVGELYALHYYGRDMTASRRAQALSDARTAAETLLVAILAAEQSQQRAALPAPAIVQAEEIA